MELCGCTRLLFPAIMLVLGACIMTGDREAEHCESEGFIPDTPEFEECYIQELAARRCELRGFEPGSDDCFYDWRIHEPRTPGGRD